VGSAIVHDDTGIMHASMVKDMSQGAVKNTGIMHAAMVNEGAGAAVIHDDAGNVR
jgi:hypothetical protein